MDYKHKLMKSMASLIMTLLSSVHLAITNYIWRVHVIVRMRECVMLYESLLPCIEKKLSHNALSTSQFKTTIWKCFIVDEYT